MSVELIFFSFTVKFECETQHEITHPKNCTEYHKTVEMEFMIHSINN